ncbi:MAG: hypothetical protein CM15mP56_1870 [Alphaproteobacteria bacterium]|nr:MAG: hypothetical protein CM15mP56_1870 [Alphaproteobacteria bacterium]
MKQFFNLKKTQEKRGKGYGSRLEKNFRKGIQISLFGFAPWVWGENLRDGEILFFPKVLKKQNSIYFITFEHLFLFWREKNTNEKFFGFNYIKERQDFC